MNDETKKAADELVRDHLKIIGYPMEAVAKTTAEYFPLIGARHAIVTVKAQIEMFDLLGLDTDDSFYNGKQLEIKKAILEILEARL